MLEGVVSSKTLRWMTILTTVLGFGLLVGGILLTTPTYTITYTGTVQEVSTGDMETQSSVLEYQQLTSGEQDAVTQAVKSGTTEINPQTIYPVNSKIYITTPDSSQYNVFDLTIEQGNISVYLFVGLLLLVVGLLSGLGYSITREIEISKEYQRKGIRPAKPDEDWQYIVIDSESSDESDEYEKP